MSGAQEAGTYLYDVVFMRRTGIASVLARVFAPLFLGTVRDHNRGRKVTYLVYEAYAEMAESEMTRIETRVNCTRKLIQLTPECLPISESLQLF